MQMLIDRRGEDGVEMGCTEEEGWIASKVGMHDFWRSPTCGSAERVQPFPTVRRFRLWLWLWLQLPLVRLSEFLRVCQTFPDNRMAEILNCIGNLVGL